MAIFGGPPRCGPASGGGSTGTLSGTVTNESGGAAVGGGVITLYTTDYTQLLYTVTVQNDGTYTKSGLTAGSYGFMAQPKPPAWLLGSTEPSARTVTITGGSTTTQNVVVQATTAYADFSLGWTNGQIQAGTPWTTNDANNGMFALTNTAQMSNDATAGPSGGPTMRWDFPSGNGVGADYTIAFSVRRNPSLTPSTIAKKYFRVVCAEQTGWECGISGAGGNSYKYIRTDWSKDGSPSGDVSTFLRPNGPSADYKHTGLLGWLNSADGTTSVEPIDIGYYSGTVKTWNCFVLEVLNPGTSSCTFNLWQNGLIVGTMTGSFMNGQNFTGYGVTLEPGVNINNGPQDAQSRWFHQIGVSDTRPSLVI